MAHAATEEARKGRDIARCLGYRDIGPCTVASGEDGTAAASALAETDAHNNTAGVDLWRLRALALQPGGLINSRGRKLGWIKLGGVDALVFQREHANVRLGAPENALAYAELQKALEEEMDVSRWHIQRERRALRKQAKRDDRAARSSSGGELASMGGRSRGMSHASSVNTLSSLASFESENDLSTPLAANLSGTPKPGTFKGLDLEPSNAAGAGVSFTAFATSKTNGTSSPVSACPSLASLDTARLSPASSEESSLLITSPPRSVAEGQPAAQFQWSLAPRRYQLQQYKRQPSNEAPARVQKDRRQQERRLLAQIATSAFYLLQYEQDDDFTPVHVKCCQGLSDLIAVLLLHLESPSLTSLLLKQILKSHLRVYRSIGEIASSDESFASCLDEIQSEDVGSAANKDWDALSLGFFPLLQLLDGDLHSGLWVEDEQSFLCERVFIFGEILQKWTSSWFCCHQALSLGIVSRLVDLFLASHPSMPLYLSTAMLCHPTHRAELLALAQHPSPFSSGSLLASLLGSLLSDLPREVAGEDNCTEPLVAFVEQSISTAIAFMKRVPPQSLTSLVNDYQNGILMPYISTGGLESIECTWTKRSLAPTDYNMVWRMFTDTAIEESPLSCHLSAEYQLAMIASGLAVVDSNKEEGRGMAWKRPEMTPRRAIVLGMALCAGAKLLQLHNTPPGSEAIGSFDGGSSAESVGMALLVGLQSLVLPLAQLEPPQALDSDEEVSVIDLPCTESDGSVGSSPFIAHQQPVVLINAEVLHDIFGSAPTSEEELLVQSLEDSTEAVLSPGNSATSRTISLFACEDEFDEETSLDVGAAPSRSVSSGPAARSPYAIRDDLKEVIDKLSDLLLDTIAATETREFMSTLPDHGESADPDGQLLDPNTKKGGPKRPAVSIPNKVKSYASRSRKLGAGIKNRLRGWKKDYKALADGDILI
ncbi:hypothetical protein ACHAXT_002829 [Thalassiosira profunda]